MSEHSELAQAISDRIRHEAWQGYIDAARLYRYYTMLSAQFYGKRRALQFLLGFAAVGGLSRFIGLFPEDATWVSELASVAVLVIVVWDFMADYATKASVLHSISVECGKQESAWRALWDEIDDESADEEDIRKRVRALEADLLIATAVAGYSGVKEHRALNETATKEVYTVMAARYATEGGGR